MEDVWNMVERYVDFTRKNDYFTDKRTRQAKYWMYESINEQLRNHFYQNPTIESLLESYENKVLNDEVSSFVAANTLLDTYFKLIRNKE